MPPRDKLERTGPDRHLTTSWTTSWIDYTMWRYRTVIEQSRLPSSSLYTADSMLRSTDCHQQKFCDKLAIVSLIPFAAVTLQIYHKLMSCVPPSQLGSSKKWHIMFYSLNGLLCKCCRIINKYQVSLETLSQSNHWRPTALCLLLHLCDYSCSWKLSMKVWSWPWKQ